MRGLLLLPLATLATAYPGLAWFVHITDLHVSHLEDPARTADLHTFTTSTLAALRPAAVLCGGDLTDAKRPGHLTADQSLAEWEAYTRVVDARWAGLPWLDIRGNHDTLDVLGRNSSSNMFAEHGVQGREGRLHSYLHPWASEDNSTRVNFVAVDATWEVGMTFPFNFEGFVDEVEMGILEGIRRKLEASPDPTIMFGHYPTSVVYQSTFLRELLLEHGLVYLSGHLHDLMMLHATHLHTFHGRQRGLELELADWKYNRAFRLLALDQGSLSFADLRLGAWPVLLPTFPKDAAYWQPELEVLEERGEQRTVRVLVFSDVPIAGVTVTIDDDYSEAAVAVAGGPLYEAPWPAAAWARHSAGRHTLTVTATDAANRTATTSHTFALTSEDAVPVDSWFANLVLRSSFVTMFHAMFVLTLVGNLAAMLALRLRPCTSVWRPGCRLRRCWLVRLADWLAGWLVRRLALVMAADRLFYPLVCWVVYTAAGPWVLGRLVEGRVGAVFAWGVVLAGGGSPHSQTTFVWYFLHLGVIHPLVVAVLGHLLHWRAAPARAPALGHALAALALLLATAVSVFFSLSFWLQFGVLGFLLCPLKTWSYVFYPLLFYLAWTLPQPPGRRGSRTPDAAAQGEPGDSTEGEALKIA